MRSSDVFPAERMGRDFISAVTEMRYGAAALDVHNGLINSEVVKFLKDVAFFLAAGPGKDRLEAYMTLQESISDVYAKFDSR